MQYLLILLLILGTTFAQAQSDGFKIKLPTEADYYPIETISGPKGLRLEVSGITLDSQGQIYLALRKGEIWIFDEKEPPSSKHRFRLFAEGLHEPLGLTFRDGWFYLTQRTEVTRIKDSDRDGKADTYECLGQPWGVTGNYHEYAYGPAFDHEGNLWVSLNQTLGKKVINEDHWRGWSMKMTPNGEWLPVSTGLRSPCGIGENSSGDIFITDQQGNWIPTCSLQHLEPGDFHGHVSSLRDVSRQGSPVKDPGKVPSGLSIPQAHQKIKGFKRPAIWFPYRKMGQAATDLLTDNTQGKFGPFKDQIFVGEFTLSQINRVYLEKVKGVYQGACFPFRKGFQSAVFRLEWDSKGNLLAGETNRGWNSLGSQSYGFERLKWTGKVPFEVLKINAKSLGFRITLTHGVNPESVHPESIQIESYTYKLHSTYGSPEIDRKQHAVKVLKISPDRKVIELQVENLRRSYVHEFNLSGIRSTTGLPLLHPKAYYTLNEIP